MKKETKKFYNKFGERIPHREAVWEYIRDNAGDYNPDDTESGGLTSDEVMEALGLSVKNNGRLTQLTQSGYLINYKVKGQEGRYWAKDKNRVYSHLDSEGKERPKMSKLDKFEKQLGKNFIRINHPSLNDTEKRELINKLLSIYCNWSLRGKSENMCIAEMNVWEIDLTMRINAKDIQI